MPRRVALIVAVERYLDPAIKGVAHAEADATAFAAAKMTTGVDAQDLSILLTAEATKASIESSVRTILQTLAEGDEFIFYYAGHGFYVNGTNYLSSHDTRVKDLFGTAVSIQSLFDDLKVVACNRAMFFLDACASGIQQDERGRDILASMSMDDLQKHLKSTAFSVCFSSCRSDQRSWSSDKLGHGIWSYHLFEALSGEAPDALENGLVTSRSLQAHLQSQVPKTVRLTFGDNRAQTPWYFGAQAGEFIVADLRPVLIERSIQAALTPVQSVMRQVSFTNERSYAIKSLRGFDKKFHQVPSGVTAATQSFVRKLIAEEVKAAFEEVAQAMRNTFGYKRKEISAAIDGADATIVTPDFDYYVTGHQDPDAPTQALLTQGVTNISNPLIIESEAFRMAFQNVFSTLVFQLPDKLNVEDVIDRLEDLGRNDLFSLNYDAECTYCSVTLSEGEQVIITPSTLEVRAAGRTLVGNLVGTFGRIRDTFILEAVVPVGLLERSDE